MNYSDPVCGSNSASSLAKLNIDTLPQPSPDALEASSLLSRKIAAEIGVSGGWIPFSRFMELALYCPGLGYYSAGAAKFGTSGDFVTAPEISPLFGACIATTASGTMGM